MRRQTLAIHGPSLKREAIASCSDRKVEDELVFGPSASAKADMSRVIDLLLELDQLISVAAISFRLHPDGASIVATIGDAKKATTEAKEMFLYLKKEPQDSATAS